MPRHFQFAVALCVLSLAACDRIGRSDAEALVRRYNERNIQAFRSGDARLTEETTGEAEGKKLVGLIGVRADLGLVLDASILEFEVTDARRADDGWEVETRERWHWQQRKASDGSPVGPDSTDAYWVRYRLGKEGDRMVVLAIEFLRPPEIGTKQEPWRASARDLHGLPAKGPAPAPTPTPGQVPPPQRAP
jgi:hypothetical protein